MEGKNFWIFQYTHGSRIDQLLGKDGAGIVQPWLWNNLRTEPQSGEIVFFLRAGKPPKDHSSGKPWRGITGVGVVSEPPVPFENAQSKYVVPVETWDLTSENPLPDWRIWHDHRVAPTSVLFGQQGTNFVLSQPAAQALAHAMLVSDEHGPAVEKLLAGIEPREGDALTAVIEKTSGWCNNHAARALHAARACSGLSDRRGELTWTHLLIGLVVLGSELRQDARTSALAVVLRNLALPDGDNSRLISFLQQQTRSETDPAEIDRRKAGPVDHLTPSTANVIRDAHGLSGDALITIDTLLAALLREPNHQGDEAYRTLFADNRDSLVGRIMEGGRARCPPRDLQRFAKWLDQAEPPPVTTPTAERTPEEQAQGLDTDTPPPNLVSTRTAPRVAGTLNDTVKRGEDFLDVRHEARAFARLIASNAFEPPLAIGVFGHWGTGKTFFMDRIAEALDDLTKTTHAAEPKNKRGFHRNVVRISFNAWHYMETNVWASLVDVIFKELDAWLRRKVSDQQTGDKVETLFEGLATAQTERLEAIEAFADRLQDMEAARQSLHTAAESKADHWTTLAREILHQKDAKSTLKSVVKVFGLDPLASEGIQLQAAIEEIQRSASDGKLLWTSLRARIASPLMLASLIALILVAAPLMSWLGGQLDIAPAISALTGLASAATAWISAIAYHAKTAVGAMRKLNTIFEGVEARRAASKQSTLTRYQTKINEARNALALAEAAAAAAQRELRAGSAAGRIAAFIRSRAEGDTYAKHLGIIDTIRRDFEQLTALMTTSREQAQQEIEALNRQQADLAIRIEALRTRYLGSQATDADQELFLPVATALDRMSEINQQGNPLGVWIDRIVLFIDDLDRCPPDKVYRVLQAVHLFLNFPLFVIVVGVDTRWMETSLVKELGALIDGSRGTTAQDYLEKIFQIPYWTRRMDPSASRGFVEGVLKRIPAEQPPTVAVTEMEREAALVSAPTSSGNREENPDGSDSAGGSISETESKQSLLDNTDSVEESIEDVADLPILESGPVIVTEDERSFIRSLAPQAGRSPRQLLRFVNVYGLIKSVSTEDGSPLIDPESDSNMYRALLAQLAIATGSPSSAEAYFGVLSDYLGDDLNEFRGLVETAAFHSKVPKHELENLRAVMFELFRSVGLPINKFDGMDLMPETSGAMATELFIKLRETAPIARRYTFASIDAVLATAPLTDEPSPLPMQLKD